LAIGVVAHVINSIFRNNMMDEEEEITTRFDPAKPHEESAENQYQMPEALAEIVADLKQQAASFSRVEDLRGVFSLCCVWSVILATSALAVWLHHPIGYAIAFLIFGSSQIALSVLVHEGAHQRLFSHPRVNAAAADLFLALPLGIFTSRYQCEHPSHHSFPNHPERDLHWALDWGIERDFWQWPKSPLRVATLFLRDMLFLNIRQNSLTFRRYCAFNPREKLSRAEAIRVLAFVSVVGLVLVEVESAADRAAVVCAVQYQQSHCAPSFSARSLLQPSQASNAHRSAPAVQRVRRVRQAELPRAQERRSG